MSLAVLGSDLYAAGGFTTADGVPANKIAKWNGSTWSAVGGGVEEGFVNNLAISGTDVYIGGTFEIVGGVIAHNLAKWTDRLVRFRIRCHSPGRRTRGIGKQRIHRGRGERGGRTSHKLLKQMDQAPNGLPLTA